MTYRLTIERVEKNEAYAEELKAWNDRNRYSGNMGMDGGPRSETVTRTLTCDLTAEEFAAVKKAALEVMA